MTKFNFLAAFALSMLLFSACLKDSGKVEVKYTEASAIYGDIEEVRNQAINLPPRSIGNPGKIFIGGSYILIGEEGKGIHVLNNENRDNPVQLSFINIPGNREFFVEDNFLYAESYYDIVKLDISTLADVTLLDRAEYAIQDQFINQEGETLIGFEFETKTISISEDDDFYQEIAANQVLYYDYARNVIPNSAVPSSFAGNSASQSGTVNRISKAKDHIYAISNHNLIILEDQSFGDFKRLENVKSGMETIFPHADHLFVGSRSAMSIFDIANPSNPQEVYDFDHATSCDPVLPHNETAYVTLRTADFSACPGNTNSLLVIDISNLSSPSQVKEIPMNSPYGMTIIDDLLYVGEGIHGLKIYDISSANNPILLEYHQLEAYDIIADPIDKNIIFIAGPDGLKQFDNGTSGQSWQLMSSIEL